MKVFPTLDGLAWPVTRRQINKTRIQTSASGREMRATYWRYPKFEFELTFNYLTEADYDALAGFFAARQGQLDSFYFDAGAGDNTVTDEPLDSGTGGNYAFNLTRSLGSRVLPVDASFGDRSARVNGSPASATFRNIAAGDNLIVKSNFEDGQIGDWYVPSGPATLLIQSVTGQAFQYGLVINANSASLPGHNAIESNDTMVPVRPGMRIFRGGWCYSQGADGTIRLAVDFYRADGSIISTPGPSVPTRAGWAYYDGIIITPNAAAMMRPGRIFWETSVGTNNLEVGPQKTIADHSFALVSFDSAPSNGAPITWSGSYYYRCRFKDAELELDEFMSKLHSGDSITLRTC